MSDKKYSVFISSTYDDLKDERTAVLRAILQHGHFPLGMELWGAADEQQWQIIQRQIDVADYYVVIVAHRYGSLSDTGVSWTEREYDYAIEKGVPVLGFVQKGGSWPPDFVDKGENAERLERFRGKVQTKPVSFWSSSDHLRTEVVLALGRQIQSTPQIGWIRGTDAITPGISVEMARLSHENSELRRALSSIEGNRFPELALEVVDSTLAVIPHSQKAKPHGALLLTLDVCAALRSGTPPGLIRQNCSISVSVSPELAIHLEPTFPSDQPLVIESPVGIRITGYVENISLDEMVTKNLLTVSVAMKPIGHEKAYSLSFDLKRSEGSRDLHANWSYERLK